MNINEAIKTLEKSIYDPTKELPEEIFLFIGRNVPVVNVDLLIKDENSRTLLSWRNDPISGKGWHIPGGVLRLKETLEDRARKVAELEIGAIIGKEMTIKNVPIKIMQCIIEQKERCHFISFLYECYLSSSFIPYNKDLSINDAGFLMWHDKCPDNLLDTQEIYREYIKEINLVKL